MNEAPDLPARPWGAVSLLAVVAAAIVVAFAMTTDGSRTQVLVSEGAIAAAGLIAAATIQGSMNIGLAWPGARGYSFAFLMIGIGNLVFLLSDARESELAGPRPADLVYLAVLVPIVLAARAEYRARFLPPDRVEIAADAGLIAASLAAIAYMVIHPANADTQTALSAAVFAVVAAVPLAAFAALTIWSPRLRHVAEVALFALLAIGLIRFGWGWTRNENAVTDPSVVLPLSLGPLAFTSLLLLGTPRGVPPQPQGLGRFARPVLTSVSIVAACGGLALVAYIGDRRGIDHTQSVATIAILGAGVAARIIANQITSSRAHAVVRAVLKEKESALGDTDSALAQVRRANETLRRSEEHLRLVFDTAVDGIVELDERDVIVRANEAFSRMVGLDRAQIEGEAWTAVAAVVDGADASFFQLPSSGHAQIERTEGQPLHLESRYSSMPTDPPRRLLVIRDVTAARVADQTIRSLFQFLQDRDEDRTRLMRRTNAAIEGERNRIARDLHDGPVQGVSAASLSLEAALLMLKAGDVDRGTDVLGKIRQELAEEADGLRRLMAGLRPPVLEERGLIPALRDALTKFEVERDIDTELVGSIERPIPDDLETLAFRVVQEALSNAGKHAEPSKVSVHVEANDVQLRIEIEDDGKGFDSARTREFLREGRVGLASMRERVELASGTFTVRSTPGRGTSIVATLPIDVEPAAAPRPALEVP